MHKEFPEAVKHMARTSGLRMRITCVPVTLRPHGPVLPTARNGLCIALFAFGVLRASTSRKRARNVSGATRVTKKQ